MLLSVIVPAYNEAEVIAKTINRLNEYFSGAVFEYEIIIVDDGSTDQTAAIVQEKAKQIARLKLLSLPKNIGKGGAVRAGALAAQGEWILFLDADLSTDPSEFEKFKPYLQSYDIVIGSRAIAGAVLKVRQSLLRELTGRFLNLIFRIFLKLPFADTQCGFKLFNARTKILFEQQQLTGWLFDAELLYLALQKKYKVKELPVVWSNDPTSQVKVRHLFSILKDLLRIKSLHA